MIHRLADIVTDFFVRNDVISKDDREVYQYGNEIIISSAIDIAILFTFGLIFNNLLYLAPFWIVFFLLRAFGGGYHAQSYFKCKMVFILNVLAVVGLLYNVETFYNVYSMLLLILFSQTVVFATAPIENIYKPLDEQDIKRNRIRCRMCSLATGILVLITYCFNIKFSVSLLLASVSVSVAMIIEYLRKEIKCNEFVLYVAFL